MGEGESGGGEAKIKRGGEAEEAGGEGKEG